MNDEYASIMKNQTWELVELPENKVPIGSKWLYKTKFKADGTIDKFKERLVAKGYAQKEGIDYEDTFSPVAKLNTIRLLIALATKHNWNTHQLDVKSAFLNGDLKEEVYLVQLEGFVKQGQEHLVCRLRKALYDGTLYRQLVGSLNYLTTTRPDIAYSVSILSQFMAKPSGHHWNVAKKVLRYLKGKVNLSIMYTDESDVVLTGFSDSDWAGNPDDKRSTSGYAFHIGSGVVAWSSKKQPTVSLS
eukprot:PITA_18303